MEGGKIMVNIVLWYQNYGKWHKIWYIISGIFKL